MPWWGWILVALGVGALLGLSWFALFLYLMSKGDRTE